MLKSKRSISVGKNQKGSVLLMALIFLVLTAMISVTIMDTSILEVKMAGNMQFKEEALQVSEGALQEVMEDYGDTLPINITYGETYCDINAGANIDTDGDGVDDTTCQENTLDISDTIKDAALPADLAYFGTRLHSSVAGAGGTASASSGTTFHHIQLDARYNGVNVDGVALGLSQASLAIGVKISQFTPAGGYQRVETEVGTWSWN